jgi:hypothetical protein
LQQLGFEQIPLTWSRNNNTTFGLKSCARLAIAIQLQKNIKDSHPTF